MLVAGALQTALSATTQAGFRRMADSDRNIADAPRYGATIPHAEALIIDAGLRAYMLRIYNYMALGLAITGLAALGIYLVSVTDRLADAAYVVRGSRVIAASAGLALQSRDILLTSIGYTVFVGPLKWVFIVAPVALVFALSFGLGRLRPARAQLLFWIYAALVGLSLGSIFLVFTHTSIVRVFFITAASFSALSLWGYTTKRDLTGIGAFLMMGLIGLVIAGVVNLFLQSSGLQWVVSVIGVLVFAGFTAWNTQQLKNEYLYGAMDGDTMERAAILGALSLYLNFINMFLYLLQLFGERDQ
jgi:FtsH-binding integral membrane protein